jgi:MFS family permease
MAALYLILFITVLNHASFKGSKVLISLFAIDLGANPFMIGVLFAMYSVFPVFLSLHAGKVSDRLGFRLPMILGSCGLLGGLLVPYAVPSIGGLFVSATLIGMCYIFYVVAIQHLVGSFGEGIARTRNYSLFAISIGITSLIGPTLAGFSIDGVGHRATYLVLAAIPLVPILMLLFLARYLPQPKPHGEPRTGDRVMDLLGNAPLRRVLLTGGILETGNELFNFLLPIYAHSKGLSASQIGLVMAAFAAALLLVRALMPALVRRSSETRVLAGSLAIAGVTCLSFPFAESFALLAAISFSLGLGLGCGAPLSMVLIYNRSPAGRTGEAIGLRQSVNKGIEVLVPLVFGSLSTVFGMLPVFWLVGALLGGGSCMMRFDVAAQRGAAAPRGPGRP